MSAQPELVCSRCQPTETENARLRQALASMQAENNELAEEVQDGYRTRRLLERENRTLKAEITKRNESSPDAQKITSILETWVRVSGKQPKRVNIDPDSDRAKLIRTMSRKYSYEDVMEAIKGAALLPYMAFGRRVIKSENGAKLSMELKQIIGKSEYLEENRDNYRRAQYKGDTDRMWEACEQKHAEYLAYADVVLDGLMRRESPELVVLLDDLDDDLKPERHLRAVA